MVQSKIHKTGVATDPVCGMDVDMDKAKFNYEWKDQTYYFCAKICREKFASAPDTYLKESSFFLKRMWDSYLTRLNKITNGKGQCCH